MNPKVSVIMPSLNVAGYIRECMDSVLCQTLGDIEVICVDAGSDDGTLEILRQYEAADSRVRVIVSGKRSYGHQANLGLDAAKGKYIGLVDTDDFIRREMYETLYGEAEKTGADFVKSDFEVFVHAANGERIYMPYPVTWACSARYGRFFAAEDYARSMQTPDVFLWNGIYRKDFLDGNGIRFNETNGAAIQDCGVRYKIALCAEKGYYINTLLYCYRRDNMGASSYSNNTILYHLDEYESIIKFAGERCDMDMLKWSFLAREMAIVTFRTYQDLLIWGRPSDETDYALDKIREIISRLERKGALSSEYMNPNAILEARLFLDNPELCRGFAETRARAIRECLTAFLKKMAEQRKIWIFGSKRVADYAYLFLRNNGIESIAGFFDNDENVQGRRKFGLPIVNPAQAVEGEGGAYFLIATSRYVDEIKGWLMQHGIPSGQFRAYGENFEQLLHPFICTNKLIIGDSRT